MKKTVLKKSIAIMGILVILLSISACGAKETDAVESESLKTVTVLVAGTVDPEVCDPILSTSDFRLYEMIYEPLVRYGDGGKIEPGLAERWEVSDDGKKYTFYLRENVKFSDGTDFNADSVVSAASRWDPETFSSKMGDIEKVDEYVVSIEFEEACYPCLTELTYPRPYRIAGENSFDGNGNFIKMIGTGPWMIESYEANQQAVLIQNPYYYGEKPKLDKIVVKEVKDGQSRLMALQSGEADISISDIPSESLSIVEGEEDLSIFTTEGTMGFFLILNNDNSILEDINVRKALNYAVNKSQIVSDIVNDMGTEASGILPQTNPYVTEENNAGYDYDINKAKELLKDAGYESNSEDGILYKDGEKLHLKLALQTEEYTTWKPLCEYFQYSLSEIGMDIELEVLESSAYYDAIWSTHDYDMIIYRTYEDSWNPHGFLRSMFYSSTPGESIAWYDKSINAKLEEIITIMDENKRQESYDDIFAELNDKAVTVPLYYPKRWYVYNNRLIDIEAASTSYEGIKWNKLDVKE